MDEIAHIYDFTIDDDAEAVGGFRRTLTTEHLTNGSDLWASFIKFALSRKGEYWETKNWYNNISTGHAAICYS